jgi:DsbC/DsbD-like thiol-disulfide interchange protein
MEIMGRFFMWVVGNVGVASVAWLVSAQLGTAQGIADEHVKLELFSEQNALVSKAELFLGIRFTLQDGWHTYWINPGDSGEAPRIEWQLPVGFQAGPIQWPYPERLATPPFADYGYENGVLLMASVRPPARLSEGETAKIAAQVHYLICRDICIPGQKHLALILPVKNHSAASPESALFAAARARVPRPMPRNWKISATSTGDEFVLNLRPGKFTKVLEFFPLQAEQIENGVPQKAMAAPGGLRLHLKKSKRLLKSIARLEGVVVLDDKAYLANVPVRSSNRSSHN